MPSLPPQGTKDVRKLYADVVRAIMRHNGRFEAQFTIKGECKSSGFWVTMPQYCPKHLVIIGVSVFGRESMDHLLGDPRTAIGIALAAAGVQSPGAFRTVTNQPATRDNLQCAILAEVPSEAIVRDLYVKWCTRHPR